MLDGNRTRRDIWRYDVERREAKPLLESPFNESGATFSPGGRWIAYVSDEDQRNQVYVRSFPDGLVRTQVSASGGSQPQWRRCAVRNREVSAVHSVRKQGLRMQGVEQVDAVRAQLFWLKMAHVRRDDACPDRGLFEVFCSATGQRNFVRGSHDTR